MIISEIEKKVLDITTEDFCGLWEILSIVELFYQNESLENLKVHVEALVRSLTERELVKFYRGTVFSGEQLAMDSVAEINEVFSKLDNWNPNLGVSREHVRIAATDYGEQIYCELQPPAP